LLGLAERVLGEPRFEPEWAGEVMR
jgi:hypothetical protein